MPDLGDRGHMAGEKEAGRFRQDSRCVAEKSDFPGGISSIGLRILWPLKVHCVSGQQRLEMCCSLSD